MLKHLSDSASQIPRERLVEIHDASSAYLSKIAIRLPKNVRFYIQEALDSKAVPSPKALIKDHKDPDENGNFPSRLVIPATNFNAPFAKVGYLGIKGILDKNKIIYDKFTIQNAHDLKKVLETEKFRRDKNTAFALDIESMYPSIKFKLVRASILYFTRKIPKDKKKNLDLFIEMIGKGMDAILLTFGDKYFEYGGGMKLEDKGLAIGGYESAWLADLAIAYIFEKSKVELKELAFKRIYRDDGLGIMKRRYSVEEMDAWLRKFQAKTNEICGNQHLVWTIEIWDPGEGPKLTDVNPKVKLIRKNMFPFLDMKISWKPNGLMAFGVYRKKNQLLK